jgi:hypothetical protein
MQGWVGPSDSSLFFDSLLRFNVLKFPGERTVPPPPQNRVLRHVHFDISTVEVPFHQHRHLSTSIDSIPCRRAEGTENIDTELKGTVSVSLVVGNFITFPFPSLCPSSFSVSSVRYRSLSGQFEFRARLCNVTRRLLGRPPLWSSAQSSSLQIQGSGFDSRRYHIF